MSVPALAVSWGEIGLSLSGLVNFKFVNFVFQPDTQLPLENGHVMNDRMK